MTFTFLCSVDDVEYENGIIPRIFTTACHQQVTLFEDDAGNILVNKVPALRVKVDPESRKYGLIELPDQDFGGLFSFSSELREHEGEATAEKETDDGEKLLPYSV